MTHNEDERVQIITQTDHIGGLSGNDQSWKYANLLKWNTSCHKLDHVSGFYDYVWIPRLPCCADCHASLNNIKLTLQSLQTVQEWIYINSQPTS